jgi:hypothetical protein
MDAQTTLNAAIAAGYDRLSPRDVMLCALYGASNGGGGNGGWTHGAGSPIANGISPVTYSTYTNDTDSSFWTVANGGWIQLV